MMCLAVPAQVVSCDKNSDAIVDLHGNQLPVSILLVPHVEPGDWVLVHAGFAIQRLEATAALAAFGVLNDVGNGSHGDG